MTDQWSCEAYGRSLAHLAAADQARLCFVSEAQGRACDSPAECGAMMAIQRQRLFDRIRELAETGDPVYVQLAEDFHSPDRLLGGKP